MSNSSLISATHWMNQGTFTEGRLGNKITEICIHHASGVLSVEQLANVLRNRKISSTYGIGNDGKIALYCNESNIPWTNSNWASNCRSVTIETSNSLNGGNWPVSDVALNSLIKLVADIAKRNNMGTLVKGKNLTWHLMYANTDCPGPYLLSKLDYIIAEANKINSGTSSKYPFNFTLKKGTVLYNVSGIKYKNPTSDNRTVSVLGLVGNRYQVKGSTFDPNIVYVNKDVIDGTTVKYPYNGTIKKGSYLYNADGAKYKNPTAVDRSVSVLEESGSRLKVNGKTFNPNIVYVDKTSMK